MADQLVESCPSCRNDCGVRTARPAAHLRWVWPGRVGVPNLCRRSRCSVLEEYNERSDSKAKQKVTTRRCSQPRHPFMSFQPGTCVRSTIAAVLRCVERAALHRLNQPKIFIKNKQVLIYIEHATFLALLTCGRCVVVPLCWCTALCVPGQDRSEKSSGTPIPSTC